MNIALWSIQILLALLFLMVGCKKVFQADKEMAASLNNNHFLLIGIAEILGAVGLILPWALDVVPVLTPLAAVGLALIMILAVIFHAKRKENKSVVTNIIILALTLFVAIGRFI
ncbi:MAG: DoxX family protein [Bacillus sp. (in: firmicutes)]